jgi:intracellular sulfur oxidation DsrE/DsrF family protein
MDAKLICQLLELLLEIVYCSTTLSSHDIIRLVRFVSKIKAGVANEFCH